MNEDNFEDIVKEEPRYPMSDIRNLVYEVSKVQEDKYMGEINNLKLEVEDLKKQNRILANQIMSKDNLIKNELAELKSLGLDIKLIKKELKKI